MNTRPGSWLPSGTPDVTVAVVGLVVSMALLPLWLVTSALYVWAVPAAVGIACVIYLASVRRSEPLGQSARRLEWNGAIPAQLTGIGIAGVAAAAALAGTRTTTVLLLAGAVGSMILAQIFFLSDSRLDERLILAQVLAHAIVVRYAGLFTTPGLIGVDSWTHVTEYAAGIQEAGSLAAISGDKYVLAPIHHLATVAGGELLGIPLRLALYLVVGGVVVLSILFVYGTARYYLGVRWALFATAAFALADHAIRWGMHIIPTSLGVVFFLGILYYVTRLLNGHRSLADWAMLCGFIVAITFTHQVSAFVSLVFLGCVSLAQVIVPRIEGLPAGSGHASRLVGTDGGAPSSPPTLFGVFGFHLVFTGSVWAMTPLHGEPFLVRMPRLFWITVQRSAGFLVVSGSSGGGGAAAAASEVSRLAAYLDAAGLLILLFATVLGCLALLRGHRSPSAAGGLVIAIGIMLVFTLGLPLFGIETFLPGRWYAFMYALMAVVGAAGLAHVTDRFSSRAVPVLLVLLMLAYPTSMVMAEKATLDDPTFDEQWPKYALTESEIDAMQSVTGSTPEAASPIYTDHPYRSALTRGGSHLGATMNLSRFDASGPAHDRVVYREYQSTGAPQFSTEGAVVTRQLSEDQVCPTTRNHVYANEDVLLCTQSDV